MAKRRENSLTTKVVKGTHRYEGEGATEKEAEIDVESLPACHDVRCRGVSSSRVCKRQTDAYRDARVRLKKRQR